MCYYKEAGGASADVPSEGEGAENMNNALEPHEINGTLGEIEETQKKKRNRKKGKGVKKQTDPPTIPVSELFADGKCIFKYNFIFMKIVIRKNLYLNVS